MNMLLAFLILSGLNMGKVTVSHVDPVYANRLESTRLEVFTLDPKSDLYKNGLRVGDEIISIRASGGEADLYNSTSTLEFIQKNIDKQFFITYRSNDGEIKNIAANAVEGILPGKKALGISVDRVGNIKLTFYESVKKGLEDTYLYTKLTLIGVKNLIFGAFKGEANLNDLAGPVGIANIIGEAKDRGLEALFFITAILSISLAVFNILPFPALDGGRIMFVLWEVITRKKVSAKVLGIVNSFGFILLILLMIVVTSNDVIKLFK
jgi:Predicted membrane-associated Zn-dependent proteases 1